MIGHNPLVVSKTNGLERIDKVVFPGVGHFASAVKKLRDSGLWDALNEAVLVKKIPILGICLGMQLMARSSEEGDMQGFGWIDAEVVRFRVSNPVKFKIPHTGWNTTEINKESAVFQDVDLQSGFYFVHSYHIKCNNPSDILTTTEYDYPFTSAIQKDNIYGVQFHPEKSHDAGEQLLKNFLNL